MTRRVAPLTVTFAPEVEPGPFTGRIVLFFGPHGSGEPRLGPNWFRPSPMLAVDVKDAKPGEPIVVGGPGTVAFPRPLDELERGPWQVQAVLDKALDRSVGNGAGNGYSAPATITLGETPPAPLTIDRRVPERAFRESERVKEVVLESPLLSRFYGRPIRTKAAVILPEGFDADPKRRWPILYIVPGFGGRHYDAAFMAERAPVTPMLQVVLDPECPLGHHVFADSANNGPRGRALITELIPHIERRFRAIGTPGQRLVTGHSSGGWSSLWLQVRYPDTFGGVWSTSPDPVDFRDFQRIDLYRDPNMFVDAAGNRRPLARQGETPVLWYRDFSDMEEPLGRGEQLGSFEAVFSARGADSRPQKLWDRKTGAIDHAVARTWEKYDIRLVLERGGPRLASKLKGKVHVYTGSLDTFYLEGAVRLLAKSPAARAIGARIEIVPGKDHGTLLEPEMRRRIAREMAETLKRR